MKTKLNFTLLVVLSICLKFSAQTQEWVEMMRDPNANFYDVQTEFNNYWAGKTIEKGKGYKAFKRWEYYMAPRVYPSGDLCLPSQNYRNYRQWEMDLIQNGIPKSTAGNWTFVGPTGKPSGGGAGRLNFVRFDPNNTSIIYVGTPDGGLWKTTNGGTSWTTNTDQLAVIGVSDIAIDPTNSQIMYLATGDFDAPDTYSIGVLKSIDGGNTWNTTGLTFTTNQYRNIGRILINPTNPNIVMAFTNVGIFRSTNGGATWPIVSATSNLNFSDAEFKPGDANTVYACGTSFRKSTDGGATWVASTSGVPAVGNLSRMALAVSAANAPYVYILCAGTDNGFYSVIRSTDSGTNFTTQMAQTASNNILGWSTGSDSGGQGWYDLCIAVSPSNANEVYTGGVNIWKSTNGGTSFVRTSDWTASGTTYVHSDIHDLVFLPGSSTTIFAACDGGIFKSTNSASAWSDISANLCIAQQYRIGLSAITAGKQLAGHQDNGSNYTATGTTWTQKYGGDGMDCFIDRTTDNNMIVSLYNGDYARSTNGGASFTDITDPTTNGSEEWVSPIHQDPTTSTVVYAAGRPALYKSINIWGAVSWTALGTPTGTGNITEFAIAPSNNQIIYALKTGTNAVSKSTNGGTSFTAVSTGLPTNGQPTWVAVSNTDPDVVFVSYSGYTATSKVYKSINGGTSWTNISTGLPNIPVNCIVYENGSAGGDGIYVGTDLGVYFRDNSMTNTWVDFSSGLPNNAVSDLEIYYGTTKVLKAGTFGRGTWQSDLYSSVAAAPVASFTADNVNICIGQSVQFTSTSTGTPTSYSWAFSGGTPATSTAQNPSVVYNTAGTYNVSLTATNATGSNTSTQTAFITVTGSSTNTLPVSEGFAGATFPPTTPATWSVVNADAGATTWTNSTTVGVAPTVGNSMFFDNYNFDDSGNSDEVRLPKLNFTDYSSSQMSFHVAYAPFTQNGTIFADGLQVLASSDCGTTWNILYDKSGNTVATGNLPTIDAVTTLFVPASTQWRQETIDLTSYVGQSNVIIAFKNIAAYGNALYVDNINITGVAAPTSPTASFTASPLASNCVGQSVQFTSTSTGNPTSYSWTFPSGSPATSTSATPAVTWSTAGTYTVSLTATNANGSNTTTQSYVVNTNPTVTQGALAAVCTTSSPVTLSGGSPAGGTYSGNGVSGAIFDPSVAGAGSETITYTYTQGGCSGTATTAITVNASPSIVSTIPASACGSASLTLGASASEGTVSWYDAASGGTALATGTTFTTGLLASNTTYYAETSNGVCTSTRVAVQATINPIPTVNAPSTQNFCTGQSSGLISFTGSSASSSYAWANNNLTIGLAASGSGNIAPFTPNVAGISTITVTPTLNGCVGSPQSFQITVNQTPTVTQSPLNQICVYGSPFTLSSGSPTGGTYSGTGVSAGSFNPATAGVGTFPITYSYAQNGCTGTAVANINVSACASIEDQTEQTLLLYPNPTSTILTVEGSDLVHYTTLELYDATGRVVQEWKVNKDKMSLDLSKYAVGSYSLHFKGIDNERIERVEIIK